MNSITIRLHLEKLEFSYRKSGDGALLLNNLSCDFEPGRVTALTGESGRGKSTLLYIIGLLLTPSRGSVYQDREPVSRLADRQRSNLRAQNFGFVFQNSELDPTRTILDSVLEPALYSGSRRADSIPRAKLLLERFGIDNRSTHKPGEISGGQAQRVAICRALLNSPDIILADEPTGNLDAINSGIVMDALRAEANRGATVLIATHDPSIVAFADEVFAV